MDRSQLSPLELEILQRTAHLGPISYDATPMYGVDYSSDSSESDTGHDSPPPPQLCVDAAAPEAAVAPDDGTQRLGNTDWCRCGSCLPMATVVECICCQEYPEAARKQQGCITSNADFEVLCLNPGVLRIAYLSMRHYNQPRMGEMTNECYRLTAYRQCMLWLWERLGKSNRRPLPSCMVKAIRGRFSSDEYVGFRYPPL